MADQETLKHKDLDGQAIAALIHDDLKLKIDELTQNDWPPRLVSVTIGDCDYESCRDVAGWITPVPGGGGPVTVAMLMQNTITAAHRQMDCYRSEYAANTWATLPEGRAARS